MKINCIIVDDEPASREILEKYIADCSELNLVDVCKNAMEANNCLNNNQIDLIFLDINMPRLSGMKFYKSIVNPPQVIFTTAYPEFAVEGFEVNAADYLLKPFPFDRFLKAVNKAVEIIGNKKKETGSTDFMLFKSDKKLYRVMVSDILYLEAVGDYVKIHLGEKFILVHDTFHNLVEQLADQQFVRVHKSFAVSLNKFDFIEGNQIIINKQSIPMGQAYRNDFMSRIKNREVS